jgi:potassium-dependent mechanosensitive channel
MQNWLNARFLFCLTLLFIFCGSASAAEPIAAGSFYSDRTRLIAEQTDLLKNRLTEAESELANLQRQQENELTSLSFNHTSKELRSQASLDIAVAKSNLDSISLELFESQQAVSRLEKDIQELENQLNVFTIFGVKITRTDELNVSGIKAELDYQKKLLSLEKSRSSYLLKLQKITDQTLQLQKDKYTRINTLLKSRSILQLKERQAQTEIDFQQHQSYWLQRLNGLYKQLNHVENDKANDKIAYANLQREIFYANENVNLTYLQMLIVRYHDQLQQLKITISHSSSITVLNKASDQVQTLTKQIVRVKDLLKTRISILEKRKSFLLQDKENKNEAKADLDRLNAIATQYQIAAQNVSQLDQKLLVFRSTLDQALQYELSSRQGLPGLDAKAWLDLGAKVWMVPSLTFQVLKSLAYTVLKSLSNITYLSAMLLIVLEICWVVFFVLVSVPLARLVETMSEHEFGHINLKRLCVQLLRRNLIEIALIGNMVALFSFFEIPAQSSGLIIKLLLVWLFFKVMINMARISLVETTHDHAGHDVRLYHRLKWSFLIGGVVTTLTVFIHQLPVVYEVKDLFDRAFLLFLLVVSIFLLKSWDVVPKLIMPHIDDRRLYLKKVVLMLGFLIPAILLVNSAIGLFGYVNLVLTISWYESIFILVMVGYLVIRGLLIDGMILLSSLVIRHVVNGWLWTEAFLKPLDKILRVVLFLAAWLVLFIAYGWDQRSPVVGRLNHFLHYNMVDMLNFSLTPLSLIELGLIVSVFFWLARWTREFVYRLLASRTKDMGLRNSIAMFSQYMMVVVGVFVCLRVLNIDLQTLKFVLGGFSIGIGLGLRDLANNYVCGLLLLIERPVRVGDTVTINDYEGEVTHIGGRAVTIRTWDHMEVLIPNAEIFSKSFTNWTAKDHVVRSIFGIKINRHDSPHEVQNIINQVLVNHKDVLSDPAPEVLLKELSNGVVEFEIRYFINLRQVKSRIGLRSEVLMAIWDAFEKHGIKPSYPHQEIHLNGELTELAQAKAHHLASEMGPNINAKDLGTK